MTLIQTKLPNEIIIKIISSLDSLTIEKSIAQIAPLKQLITLYITDDSSSDVLKHGVNGISIESIINQQLDLDRIFKPYHFFVVDIHKKHCDDKVYYKTHKILAKLIRLKKFIMINFWGDKIDLTYLKMFKSLFYSVSDHEEKYRLKFHTLKDIKCNSNHLLIKPFVSYSALTNLNLYYCSPTFYFQVFEYLNLVKQQDTFPVLKSLKIQDYMNEAEDAYSKTSDNHVKVDYDDYDDYDYNSDIDENEFYFDGLEIVQNFKLTNLQSLTLKNCNITILKNIQALQLTHLKILELSNKHTDAYDLNLINDSDEKTSQTTSFLNSSISTRLKVLQNQFPQLKSLKIIGHLNLQGFTDNKLGLKSVDEVIIKSSNVEIEEYDLFFNVYHGNNEILTA